MAGKCPGNMSEGEFPTLVNFREELCIVTRPHLQRTVGTVLDTTFVDLSVCGSVRHDGPTYFKQRPQCSNSGAGVRQCVLWRRLLRGIDG